jgi:hypothetical protein
MKNKKVLPVSAKDIFHESVKKALQKEQWVITDDPLKFKFPEVNFQIDLGMEKIVAAERGSEKIAVEIKSFLNPSAITDFYAALGQFLSYTVLPWQDMNNYKWFTRLAVADIICTKLKQLNLKYPTVSDEHRQELLKAKAILENENN